MQKKILWVAAALVLIAIPAVIGLVALRGDDDGSTASRRAAALVPAGPTGGGFQLTIPGVTWLPSTRAIDVLSYSWGVSNAGRTDYSGLTAGKASFNDLQITKQIDQASPHLALSAASGKHLQSAVLTLYRNSAVGQVKLATYTLTDVLIGAVQQSGSSNEIPMEQVSLNYAQVRAEFSGLDAKGGVTTAERFGWNLAANTPA